MADEFVGGYTGGRPASSMGPPARIPSAASGRPTPQALAEVAYRGYAAHTGGKTFDGRDMPAWEDLPERTVNAWVAAVEALVSLWTAHDAPVTVDVRINGGVVSEGALHETIRRAVSDYRKRNP